MQNSNDPPPGDGNDNEMPDRDGGEAGGASGANDEGITFPPVTGYESAPELALARAPSIPGPLGRTTDGTIRIPGNVPEEIIADLRSTGDLQRATEIWNSFLQDNPTKGRDVHDERMRPLVRGVIRIFQYEDALRPFAWLNGMPEGGPAPQAVFDAVTAANQAAAAALAAAATAAMPPPPSQLFEAVFEGVRYPKRVPPADLRRDDDAIKEASRIYNQEVRNNNAANAHMISTNGAVRNYVRLLQVEDGLARHTVLSVSPQGSVFYNVFLTYRDEDDRALVDRMAATRLEVENARDDEMDDGSTSPAFIPETPEAARDARLNALLPDVTRMPRESDAQYNKRRQLIALNRTPPPAFGIGTPRSGVPPGENEVFGRANVQPFQSGSPRGDNDAFERDDILDRRQLGLIADARGRMGDNANAPIARIPWEDHGDQEWFEYSTSELPAAVQYAILDFVHTIILGREIRPLRRPMSLSARGGRRPSTQDSSTATRPSTSGNGSGNVPNPFAVFGTFGRGAPIPSSAFTRPAPAQGSVAPAEGSSAQAQGTAAPSSNTTPFNFGPTTGPSIYDAPPRGDRNTCEEKLEDCRRALAKAESDLNIERELNRTRSRDVLRGDDMIARFKGIGATLNRGLFLDDKTGKYTTDEPGVMDINMIPTPQDTLIQSYNDLLDKHDALENTLKESQADLKAAEASINYGRDERNVYRWRENGVYFLDDGSVEYDNSQVILSSVASLLADYTTLRGRTMPASAPVVSNHPRRVIAANNDQVLRIFNSPDVLTDGFTVIPLDDILGALNDIQQTRSANTERLAQLARVFLSPDGTYGLVRPDNANSLPEGQALCDWEDVLKELNRSKAEAVKDEDKMDVEAAPFCNIPEHATWKTQLGQAVGDLTAAQAAAVQQATAHETRVATLVAGATGLDAQRQAAEARVQSLTGNVNTLTQNLAQAGTSFTTVDNQRIAAIRRIGELEQQGTNLESARAAEVLLRRSALDQATALTNQLGVAQAATSTAIGERNTAIVQTTTAVGQRDQLAGELREAEGRMDTVQGQLGLVTRQLDAAGTDLEAAKVERDNAQTALETAEKERDVARSALEAAKTRRDSAQTALDAAKKERDDAKVALDAAQKERDDEQPGLQAIRTERDTAQGELRTAQTELATAKAALETTKTKLTTAEDELATAKTNLTTAENDLATAQTDLATSKGETATAQTKLTTAEGELAAASAALSTSETNLENTRTELKDAKTALEEEQAKELDCQKLVTELQAKSGRKVLLSNSTGQMTIVDGDTEITPPDQSMTIEEAIAEASRLSSLQAEGDCGYQPHAKIVENLEAAKASQAELEVSVKAAKDSEAAEKKAREDAEVKHAALVKELEDKETELEAKEAEFKAAQDALKTSGDDANVPPAYQIAITELRAAKEEVERELARVKAELERSRRPPMPTLGDCTDSTHNRLQGMATRLEREKCDLLKEKDALQKRLDALAATVPGPNTCNVKEHEDLLDEKRRLKEQYDALEDRYNRLERGEPESDDCTIQAHRDLEAQKKQLQDDYNLLYDYTYLLQQDGWDLLNHLAIRPLD